MRIAHIEKGLLARLLARLLVGLLVWLALCGVTPAEDLPISGKPDPALQIFDQTMQDFMSLYDISAGVLGIMNDGRIVYERGFGWKDHAQTVPLPEDAMMRIASCSKPITAAAIRRLADEGAISLDACVFDLGQLPAGILAYSAFPSLGDDNLDKMKVQHLLDHQSGWDLRPDPTYEEVSIALVMRVFSPPGRIQTARYAMGQALQVFPGTPDCTDTITSNCYAGSQYSNLGYMLLGLILEQESGMKYIDCVRSKVFGPIPGVTGAGMVTGRTFAVDHDPREPWYDSREIFAQNVFDPFGTVVASAYGGWDHEARVAQGGLVAETETLLRFLEHYTIDGSAISSPPPWDRGHTGSLREGTQSIIRQRSDGVNYVVVFNKRGRSPHPPYHNSIQAELKAILDAGGIDWPTRGVDGTWVDFHHPDPGSGNFDDPYNTLTAGLARTPAEARIRIKGGQTEWTGVIDQPVELHSTLGTAVLGAPP